MNSRVLRSQRLSRDAEEDKERAYYIVHHGYLKYRIAVAGVSNVVLKSPKHVANIVVHVFAPMEKGRSCTSTRPAECDEVQSPPGLKRKPCFQSMVSDRDQLITKDGSIEVGKKDC